MLALVSAMFTVSWIQRHNEMTALMAAGVSRFRVLLPIICAVAGVSLLSAANRELVIPRLRSELSAGRRTRPAIARRTMKSCRDNQTDVEIDGKSTYAGEKRIEEPVVLLDVGAAGACASMATELPPTTPTTCRRKATARADTCSRACTSRNISTPAPRCRFDGEPVLITPRDAPTGSSRTSAFLRSNVEFEQLTPDARPIRSWPQRRS